MWMVAAFISTDPQHKLIATWHSVSIHQRNGMNSYGDFGHDDSTINIILVSIIITIIISLLYPSTWLLFPHTPIVAKFCLYPHKTSILTQQSLQNTCCHPHLLCSSHWLTEYRLRTQLSSIGKVHKFSNESVHWQYQFKLSKMLSNRFTVCSSRHTMKLKYRNSNLTRSVSIQVEVLWICFIPTGTFILTGFPWNWSVSLLQSTSLVDSGMKYS